MNIATLKGVAPVVAPRLVLKSRKTDNFPTASSSEMRAASLLGKVSVHDCDHVAAYMDKPFGKKSLGLMEPFFQATIGLVIGNPNDYRVSLGK